ncbi:hypothetical protein PoB_001049300 [Plakobranchus ocellatus]|uniref:Uncharacterized protein n=1 Tax=Plakobranchus ocellatus TaxID=259542 RepID=A0AAV3YN44_9GAST|nr:hypothetical protein PoB_001049300 [Plakobranchus ocellatus]
MPPNNKQKQAQTPPVELWRSARRSDLQNLAEPKRRQKYLFGQSPKFCTGGVEVSDPALIEAAGIINRGLLVRILPPGLPQPIENQYRP